MALQQQIIEKTRLKEVEDDAYYVQARLDIMIHGDVEVEAPRTVLVPFKLDVDYRSWGIKDIGVLFPKPIHVDYTILADDKETPASLDLDLSTAQVDWVEGKAFTVVEINVDLGPDNKPKSVTVEMSYLKP